MNKDLLKKIGLYAGILALFIGLAYGFTPEVLDGKIVNQGDISQWKGMAHEAMTYNEAHPEDPTAWSNAMFGGMPTTATIDSFEGDWTDSIYDFFLTGRRPASYLLIALIGGFLLMLALGTSTLVAVGGAIATAFCSYNFQIITAGHNTKMQAIAYFPWVLAAIIFTYRTALKNSKRIDTQSSPEITAGKNTNSKNWWFKVILGAVLFAFALSFQIKANHIQITYYLAIVILAYVVGLFIYTWLDQTKHGGKGIKKFFIASGLLLVFGGIGIATNANKLIPTYEYSKYTMRGGSELTSDSETHNQDGLNLKYATEGWSYGLEEMPNLMIPNYNGGASSTLIEEEAKADYANALKDAYTEMYMDLLIEEYGAPATAYERREYEAVAREYAAGEKIEVEGIRLPTYWGPQQYTAGPMYMGAVTIFLFALGLILCKGREKWWLLAAMIVSIFLAWGEHFMWFTKLCFDYAPMYNKFRTVSMALIVLQIAMPMLGFVVLDRIMKVHYEKRRLFIAGGVAFALTAGFCLLCMLNPNTAGTHVTDLGADGLSQWLADYRKDMLVSDATRSFILILVAAVLIALPYINKTFSTTTYRRVLVGGVLLVVLFDLWGAGKRYLNEKNFVTEKKFTSIYNPRKADNIIFAHRKDSTCDTDKTYRVLDLSGGNPFSDAIPCYHHQCILGYSPVKMQRYQDLIDRYITSEIYTDLNGILGSSDIEYISDNDPYICNDLYKLYIISMLNGKYIILDGNSAPIYNPNAYGNCWYTYGYIPAKNPDEEIALLGEQYVDAMIIGEDFKWAQEAIDEIYDDPDELLESYDEIELTHYAPNELRYSYNNTRARAALFSEIYYPKGWKAWIEPDGGYGKVEDGRYHPTADGYEIDLFRANWILRGAIVPEGKGQLIMRFEPESYRTGENISDISSSLLILMLLGSAGALIWFNRK